MNNHIWKQIAAVTIGSSIAVGVGYFVSPHMPEYSQDGKYSQLLINHFPASDTQSIEKESRERQEYLDKLLADTVIPFCEKVVYDCNGSLLSNYYHKFLMTTNTSDHLSIQQYIGAQNIQENAANTPDILDLSGTGQNVPIFITPRIFEDVKAKQYTPEDIKHIIAAHEGHHAHQHANGLSYFPPKRMIEGLEKNQLLPAIVYGVMEVDAEGNALRRIINGEFRVSASYSNSVIAGYMKGHNALVRASASRKITALENELIRGMVFDLGKYPELQDLSVPREFYNRGKYK